MDPRRWPLLVAAALACAAIVAPVLHAQRDAKGAWVGVLDEHPAIDYATRPTTDAVAALNAALGSGRASLTFEPGGGYLRSVLAALDVSPTSQMLVLSRTGVQREHTSPANPRALYFNEALAVGYIRGAPFLELIAHDAHQGAVFYTLDQRPAERPAFTRQTTCLSCHVATATLEVPGFMTRSLAAGADGIPKLRLGSVEVVDHRTPYARRWGGFFVTGGSGRSTHLGNVVFGADDAPRSLVPSGASSTPSLTGAVDLAGYAAATSDVAALAVFDHQTRALNLITRLGWESRVAAHEGGDAATAPAVTALVRELVDYLLFANEAPMPGGLQSESGFREWFSRRGAKDAQGRTLHALALDTRLFAHPLSYTIESAAFSGLPDGVRHAVYRELAAVLGSADAASRGVRVSAADRGAIVEIVKATRPDAVPFFATR